MKHTFSDELTRTADDQIDLKKFAGGIEQKMANFPQIRVGPFWFTTRQILLTLIPLGIVGAGFAVL